MYSAPRLRFRPGDETGYVPGGLASLRDVASQQVRGSVCPGLRFVETSRFGEFSFKIEMWGTQRMRQAWRAMRARAAATAASRMAQPARRMLGAAAGEELPSSARVV